MDVSRLFRGLNTHKIITSIYRRVIVFDDNSPQILFFEGAIWSRQKK
jgi:hypothetical protein